MAVGPAEMRRRVTVALPPATLQMMRRHLDRICRTAQEAALDRLADDGEVLDSGKSVRLEVYRSLRTLTAGESELRADFVRRVVARAELGLTQEHDPGHKARSLRLMSEDELKQELLCATFVAQIDGVVHPLLVALATAWAPSDPRMLEYIASAVGPRAVLEAYLQALLEIAIGAEVRVVLLREMHRQMLQELPGVYRDCLRQLGGHESGPGASTSPSPRHASISGAVLGSGHCTGDASLAESREHGPPVPVETGTSGTGMQAVGSTSPELLAAVLQLLARKAQAAQPEGQAHWSREQVTRALLLLQVAQKGQSPDSGSGPVPLADLVQDALSRANALNGRQRLLSETDRAVTDLVDMLFDFLIADAQFPVPLVAEFVKLRIPFLRLALDDRQLLLRRDSAPRQLLEALVRGAGECSSARSADFEPAWRSAVAQVLGCCDVAPSTFEEIGVEYARTLQHARKREASAERRIVDKAESRERMLAAWQEVGTFMRRVLSGAVLPPVVHELLCRPWAQYMVLQLLKHGRESAEFRSSGAVAEGLREAFDNWATMPSSTPDCGQRAMRRVSAIALELRAGLEHVGYPSQQVVSIWRCLTRLIVGAARCEPVEERLEAEIVAIGHDIHSALVEYGGAPMAAAPGPGTETALADLSQARPPVQPGADGVARVPELVVSGIEVGSFVEFHEPERPVARLKLCWRGVTSGLHIFVNQAGVKALELPAPRVRKMLADRTLIACSAEPVVERALQSILNRLGSERQPD